MERHRQERRRHLDHQVKNLDNQNYSFHSRFEDGEGTNPEELIAAAHAGCFTMALSHGLTEAGYTPGDLKTDCAVDFKDQKIAGSHLTTVANVPGIDKKEFDKIIQDAKVNCPISHVLNTEITLSYELVD